MVSMHCIYRAALIALTVLVAGCGGGGGDKGGAAGVDVFPKAPDAESIPVGLDRFLLFPNPLLLASGAFESDTLAYAQAYFAAIDPTNAKDTLDKWKTANGFNSAPVLRFQSCLATCAISDMADGSLYARIWTVP